MKRTYFYQIFLTSTFYVACGGSQQSSPHHSGKSTREIPQVATSVGSEDALSQQNSNATAQTSTNQTVQSSTQKKSSTSDKSSSAGQAGLPDDLVQVEAKERPVSATYFTEWSIYGREYEVSQIPGDKLTHILYGFLPICGDPNEDYWNTSLKNAGSGYDALVKECMNKKPGEITIHDRFAALEKSFEGDVFDQPVKGNFHQLALLKKKHPHLKIIPSIGGWTLSDPFFYLVRDPQARQNFLDSIRTFMTTYPVFDGIDIDWEFPGGGGSNPDLGQEDDGVEFARLMQDIRRVLDEIQPENRERYELTAAIGAAPEKIQRVDYQSAHPYMDYIFLMSYDYYGAWSSQTGHMTGLYSVDNPQQAGFDTHTSVEILLEQVPAQKIAVGYAAYGRGWKGVTNLSDPSNPFSSEFECTSSCAIDGTWEPGVLDYKDIIENYLDKNGFQYGYDKKAEAPYLWNSTTGELISYDDPVSVAAKANYVKQKGLAGLFSWSIDSDDGSLVQIVADLLKI